MIKLEIINKHVDELIEYEGNARKHEFGIEKVTESSLINSIKVVSSFQYHSYSQ